MRRFQPDDVAVRETLRRHFAHAMTIQGQASEVIAYEVECECKKRFAGDKPGTPRDAWIEHVIVELAGGANL